MAVFILLFLIGSAAILLFYAAIGYAILTFARMVRQSGKIYWQVHGRSMAKARVHARVVRAAEQREHNLLTSQILS
jgi:hypothetical protein